MDLGLKGKVAFVAAASQGLGRAVADELASEGASLVINSRSPEKLDTLAGDIHSRTGVDVFDLSPMRDDEACHGLRKPDGSEYDDLDAALAYLAKGGTLVKVPDYEDSPHWRLMVAVSIIC